MEKEFRERVELLQGQIDAKAKSAKKNHDLLLHEISLFSKSSMHIAEQQREQKNLLSRVQSLDQQLQDLNCNEIDNDAQILALEAVLLAEEQEEKAWQKNLIAVQKNHPQNMKKELKNLHDQWQLKTLEEECKDDVFQAQLKSEVSVLEDERLKTEAQLAELDLQFTQLHEQLEPLKTHTHQLDDEMNDTYLLMSRLSFLEIEIPFLEWLSAHTSCEELYHAVQLRLGFIAHHQQDFFKSFNHLSAVPLKVLQSLDFEDFYQQIKKHILSQYPGLLSCHRFIRLSKTTKGVEKQESFLMIAMQLEEKLLDDKPYLVLLEHYISHEHWFKAQEMIDKLRQYHSRKTSKPFKMESIIDKIAPFFALYTSTPSVSHLLKLQQMSASPFCCEFFKFDLAETHKQLIHHKDATPSDMVLSYLNSKKTDDVQELLHSCCSFLQTWYEYSQACICIKSKKLAKAETHLLRALTISPFFQEARIGIEKISPQFSWPTFYEQFPSQEQSCSSKI